MSIVVTRRSALAALGALSVRSAAAARVPVLVELFTSEGCSSCPPADRLLETLDTTQPVPDADIMVIGEHVDYWNHLGWNDPYSSAAFSRRQQEYANRFRLEGAYTPQMIVDGQSQFVGGDSNRALAEIARAATRTKLPLELRRDGRQVFVTSTAVFASTTVLEVAVVRPVATTRVEKGENAGRELRHVAVAKTVVSAGTVHKGGTCSFHVALAVDDGMRIIAWAREAATGKVIAACRGNAGP